MLSLTLKNLTLSSPLLLSPMAGYTNLPFRVALRSVGGLSLATTDLVNARSVLELNYKAMRMVAAAANDRPFGVQLFGAKRQELCDAARFLQDLGVDLIDINMGCPSPKVNAGGGGAALMQDEELTEELVAAVVAAVSIPVTVKMRLGWDDDSINAHIIAPRLEQMGVAAIAVHGRTRMQGYAGTVNLQAIAAVVRAVKQIPIIGNGDVRTHLDAERMLCEVGCRGVMVGRAALRNPFFFHHTLHYLRTGVIPPPPELRQMMLFMHYHFALMLHFYGVEDACLMFRRVIPGYSEHFAHKQRWRVAMQRLASVEEYLAVVAQLADSKLDADCLHPKLDAAYLHALLAQTLAFSTATAKRQCNDIVDKN